VPLWLELTIRIASVVVAFLTLPLLIGQAEHKVMAHMQGRLGPMYAGGYHGWAQLVADGVKFVQKESVTPAAADGPVFRLAPFVALLPYLIVLLFIPIGPSGLVAQELDVGLFLVLAVLGLGVVSVLMASWASANKYSLLGGLRAAAQLLGYEPPFGLAAAAWRWPPARLLTIEVAAVVVDLAVAGARASSSRAGGDPATAARHACRGLGWPQLPEAHRAALAFFSWPSTGTLVIAALTTVLFSAVGRSRAGGGAGWMWTLLKIRGVLRGALPRAVYPRLRGPAAAAVLRASSAAGQLVITAVGLSSTHVNAPPDAALLRL
jgi:NADH-quinone oxidoreductase subunit H